MAVHMPMLCQTRHLGTQTSQRSSQHPYRPSSAVASVDTPRNPMDSTTVVAASNLWSIIAPYDDGGLRDAIRISSSAPASEEVQDETF
eukprot:scaffold33883_cov36-Cyclotella_meneghiniana.AAC.2